MLERAERLERGLLERSGDCKLLTRHSQNAARWLGREVYRTGLGFVHGSIRVRLGSGVVMCLALLAGALFALVLGFGGRVAAFVAVEAEARL